MTTLLYDWNFTGENDLNINKEIYDSVSNLKAVVKSRQIVSNSSISRDINGIYLNNNDDTNGGYIIDLEGLDSVNLGGNIIIEMVIKNNDLTRDSIYFQTIRDVESETNIESAFLTCKFSNKTKFIVRTDTKESVSYQQKTTSETNNTIIINNNEQHYLFYLHYIDSSSKIQIYINGNLKGNKEIDLIKQLSNTLRQSNIIGSQKNESGATYFKGVIKFLKIHSVNSDVLTSSIIKENFYDKYSNAPYFSNINNENDTEKYSRRHTDVTSYFSENTGINEFSIDGIQLGLSKSTKTYKIHKFTSGSEINISYSYNYIPLIGEDKFIILKYNDTYFKITQTSTESNENSKYKCEISYDNESYSLECDNKGFGDTYSYNSIQIIFGGVEFLVNNDICFHEDTIIDTDQGEIEIKNLKPSNTIRNLKIISLLKSPTHYNILVLIKKDSFIKNYPNKDILLTEEHLILINNKFIPVGKLINNKNILRIKNNSPVYNIILQNENYIKIGNLDFNILGVSKEIYRKIIENKKKGIREMELKFSKNTNIKLDLNKFLN
tara:strand:+ start:750 stop:2402 length:1653 start_codon:yes stop_codon:yes gene_type:complete